MGMNLTKITSATNEGPPGTAETRQRLLEAGGEIFAENGFHKATVRDICGRAGANVAAVNYHFGDKEGLYRATLRHYLRLAFEKYPPDMGLAPGATADQRLAAFVRSFLFRVLGEGAPAWHGKLMSREMIEPTGALDELIDEIVRPHAMRLAGILRELLGPARAADEALIRRCVFSIVGQCIFYHHAAPVVERLFPGQRRGGTAEIEVLAAHVTQFSLAAIRGIAQGTAGHGGGEAL